MGGSTREAALCANIVFYCAVHASGVYRHRDWGRHRGHRLKETETDRLAEIKAEPERDIET